jgi:hypothetical protein
VGLGTVATTTTTTTATTKNNEGKTKNLSRSPAFVLCAASGLCWLRQITLFGI